jgi:hypothetical protein
MKNKIDDYQQSFIKDIIYKLYKKYNNKTTIDNNNNKITIIFLFTELLNKLYKIKNNDKNKESIKKYLSLFFNNTKNIFYKDFLNLYNFYSNNKVKKSLNNDNSNSNINSNKKINNINKKKNILYKINSIINNIIDKIIYLYQKYLIEHINLFNYSDATYFPLRTNVKSKETTKEIFVQINNNNHKDVSNYIYNFLIEKSKNEKSKNKKSKNEKSKNKKSKNEKFFNYLESTLNFLKDVKTNKKNKYNYTKQYTYLGDIFKKLIDYHNIKIKKSK